jgi:hypothetical protein
LSNAAHRRLLGVSEEVQVVGKTDFEILPSQEAEQNLADEQALLDNASKHKTGGRAKAGGQKSRGGPFEKTPLRDETGAVIGLLAVGAHKG